MEMNNSDSGFKERVNDIKSKIKDIQTELMDKVSKEDYLKIIRKFTHDHNKELIASGLVAVGAVAFLTYYKTHKDSKNESIYKILSVSPKGFSPNTYIDSDGEFIYLTENEKILDPEVRPFAKKEK